MVIDIKSESEQEAFIKVNSNIGMTLLGGQGNALMLLFKRSKQHVQTV
jgi:hypothetical protein